MSRSRVVVAIDGPAGAGKSTVAEGVADKLGFVRVDTGALYRGLALRAQEEGIPWDDGARMGEFARTLRLEFAATPGGPRLQVDGVDREDELRNPEVASGASLVSGHPAVRAALLDVQRELGANGGVVLEGRDIGTVIFPDAEVKVFLTASAEARANRRLKDLQARGHEADYVSLLSAIQERDARDSGREAAPLRPAEDAVHLDSTDMSFDEVVAVITELAQSAMRQP
ncbi:MAG: cytidylate kinase [Polyangiales bacterium]|jgi:cytidylate kinase